MTGVDGRRYRISKDQWQRVRCDVLEEVLRPPRQLFSLGVYCEREGGFDLGKSSPGALDLALAILVDHAALPMESTAWILTHGFCTPDIRVLEVWMKHIRLRDQRLCRSNNPSAAVFVSEWELQRLIKKGFLTGELEVQNQGEVELREQAMEKVVDEEGKVTYFREVSADHFSKPGATRERR